MNTESYRQYVVGTTSDFSKKNIRALYEALVKEKVILDGGEQPSAQCGIDRMEQEVLLALRGDEKALQVFETVEFTKGYTYSVFFCAQDFAALWGKVKRAKEQRSLNSVAENTVFSETVVPLSFHEDESRLFIKTSVPYSAIDTNGAEKLLKYTTIIVLHKDIELVEFRFGALKTMFIGSQTYPSMFFYLDKVNALVGSIEVEYSTKLQPLNTDFVVEHTKRKPLADNEAIRIGQSTTSPNGGNAQLESGKNEDYMLPLIDEIRDILDMYAEELQAVPDVKQSLEQIIHDNEELSNYSWLTVLFPNDIKIRGNRVRFNFKPNNAGYDLIKYYYNSTAGMERMNDVAKYLGKHRKMATSGTADG